MRTALLFGIPLALLALVVLLFHLYAWDLEVSGAYYDATGDSWPRGKEQPWRALYVYGEIPALAVAIGSGLVFLVGFWVEALKKYRRQAAFLALLLILGPGLVVNVVFKGGWGRPRPRDIEPYGGQYVFEKVLAYDASSPGKSFPSGHASMGFYFVGFAFLCRKRSARFAALLSGLAFGGMLGLARIIQGGHFASDVIFSAGMTFLVAAALACALRLWPPGAAGAERQQEK